MKIPYSPEYLETLEKMTLAARLTGEIGEDEVVVKAEPRDVIEDGKVVKGVSWLITTCRIKGDKRP